MSQTRRVAAIFAAGVAGTQFAAVGIGVAAPSTD